MPAKENGNIVPYVRVLVVCFLACCLSSVVVPFPHGISGTVLDARSQPIVRATIKLNGTQRGAFSDVRGHFRIDDIASDTAHITISCIGYESRVVLIGQSASNIGEVVLQETSLLSTGINVTSYRAGALDPVTQTTVSKEIIDQIYIGQDPQYVLERTVPSVIAFSESGTSVSNYGTFRVRGIDQTRVNVTLDGTPLNDMIDQGVFFSNMGDLTNGMRSVQVQRGTGMSTNGTASFAGSVNFEGVPLNSNAPSADLQLSAGTFGLLRASAAVATGRMENNVSVFARFTSLRSNGYRDHTGTVANSLYASAAWFGPSDVVKLTVVWGSTQNELGYVPVPKYLADFNPRTNLNDRTDVDDFGQQLAQLQHSHAFSENITLTSSLYYGMAGGDFFAGYRDTSGLLTQINYPLQNQHVGGMTTLDVYDVIPGFKGTVGIHAYTFSRRNWEYVSPEAQRPYYDDKTSKQEVSGFARAKYRIGKFEAFGDVQIRSVRLNFQPDARTVGANVSVPVHTWLFVNPRLGLRYSIVDGIDVYTSFGRTGREPTRFDLLGSTQINSANLFVLQNPGTVRPEYVNDLEIGARFQAPYGYLNVTGFAMMFTDEIAPIGQYIEQQFVQLRKNVSSSKRLGIEVEGSLHVTDNLWLDLTGTLMKATIDQYIPENIGRDTVYSNVTPVLTPSYHVMATLRCKPLASIDVNASLRHVAQSFTDLSNEASLVLPSFTQVDVQLWWAFAGAHRLGVMANNITNAYVITNGGVGYVQGATVPTYFVQATRNFAVVLNVRL